MKRGEGEGRLVSRNRKTLKCYVVGAGGEGFQRLRAQRAAKLTKGEAPRRALKLLGRKAGRGQE